VVVLALFGVAGFFWWRRWKRKRALETPPRDDDSETFQMRERAPTPHIIRLNPDPYQFTPSPGTPAPRMGNRNEMWNRDHGRLSPPVNNPYSIPYEGLKPGIRPYEGTWVRAGIKYIGRLFFLSEILYMGDQQQEYCTYYVKVSVVH
jgi:hypothetical protein